MALIFISVFIVAVVLILKFSGNNKPTIKTKKIKSKTPQLKKKKAGLLTGGTLAVAGLSGFFLYNTYGFVALIVIALIVTAIIITITNKFVGGIGSLLTRPKTLPKYKPSIMDTDNVAQELADQLDEAKYVNAPATDSVYHSWVDATEQTHLDDPTRPEDMPDNMI